MDIFTNKSLRALLFIAGLCANFFGAMAMDYNPQQLERAAKLINLSKVQPQENNNNNNLQQPQPNPEMITGLEKDVIKSLKLVGKDLGLTDNLNVENSFSMKKRIKTSNLNLENKKLVEVNAVDIISLECSGSNQDINYFCRNTTNSTYSKISKNLQSQDTVKKLYLEVIRVLENPKIKWLNIQNSGYISWLTIAIIATLVVLVIGTALILFQLSTHTQLFTGMLYRFCRLSGIKTENDNRVKTKTGKILAAIEKIELFIKNSKLNVLNYKAVIAAMIIFAEMNVVFFLVLFGLIAAAVPIWLLVKNYTYRYTANIPFNPEDFNEI